MRFERIQYNIQYTSVSYDHTTAVLVEYQIKRKFLEISNNITYLLGRHWIICIRTINDLLTLKEKFWMRKINLQFHCQKLLVTPNSMLDYAQLNRTSKLS